MPEMTIVKTTDRTLTDSERQELNRLLFGDYVKGLGEIDQQEWKSLWQTIKGMGAGEILIISFKRIRNGRFHRKFFALLQYAYTMWEPDRTWKMYKGMPVTKNFDRFRSDVVIAAGFYEQTFDLEGNMKLEAKSISFANMDDTEFEKVYDAVINVILDKVLTTYKGREELDQILEKVMRFA